MRALGFAILRYYLVISVFLIGSILIFSSAVRAQTETQTDIETTDSINPDAQVDPEEPKLTNGHEVEGLGGSEEVNDLDQGSDDENGVNLPTITFIVALAITLAALFYFVRKFLLTKKS